jgi:hypothetical protein
MLESASVAAQLAAAQEGLNSMKLVLFVTSRKIETGNALTVTG